MRYTPISLERQGVFDGYNIYWPLISTYDAVISLITCLNFIDASNAYSPVATAFSVIIFYIICYRVTCDRKISFLASMFFSFSGFYAIKTAGVTKDGYAAPLYLAAMYVYRPFDFRNRA